MIFTGGNSAINSHSMMREQLQSHLNNKYSLVQLIHILHETYQPLSSIAKLAIIPHLGIPVSLQSFFAVRIFNRSFVASTSTCTIVLHSAAIANPTAHRLPSDVLSGDQAERWRFGFDP